MPLGTLLLLYLLVEVECGDGAASGSLGEASSAWKEKKSTSNYMIVYIDVLVVLTVCSDTSPRMTSGLVLALPGSNSALNFGYAGCGIFDCDCTSSGIAQENGE